MPTRIISDNLLSSKKVNQLKPNEFEFYIRLLLCVDDYGFYSADPVEVVRMAYPRREMLSKEIVPVLDRLTELGLIVRYECNGELYLLVTNFINSPRAKVAKYPAPDGHLITKSEWDNGACMQIVCRLQADACNLQADACNLQQNVPLTVTVTETVNINRKGNSAMRKHKYGTYQNVLLSDEDVHKLKDKLTNYEAWIEKLSEGIERKGYVYKNHYLAILDWSRKEKLPTNQNFAGVTYTPEQLEKFEDDPAELLRQMKERT